MSRIGFNCGFLFSKQNTGRGNLMKKMGLLAAVLIAASGVAGATSIGNINIAQVSSSLNTAYGLGLPDDVDENGKIDTEDLQCFKDTFQNDAAMNTAYDTNLARATTDGGALAASLKVNIIIAMFACVDGASITDDFLDGLVDAGVGAPGACGSAPSNSAACYDFSQAGASARGAMNACLGGEGEGEG
ncbi:MAG: hypothetical protein IT368_00590, partial [Candidatus Hydrogenedentes bacterium]|nr:hypothetical protein [Candidatus Hydrogenedentota bacterium]